MDALLDSSGSRPRQAARQIAAILLMAAALAAVAIPDLHEPRHLVVIPTVACGVAVIILLLPWDRWTPSRTVWLALPVFGVLGTATWIFDGFAAGTGPLFVLVFAWLGLHHGSLLIALCVLPAALSYAAGLLVAEAPAHVLGSTLALMPVAALVGWLISRYVAELRAARDTIAREERWRSALMSTLAHDVRTPLTAIRGALEIASDDEQMPARLQPLLESAMRQTHRITRLATGLLELERVEQGELRLERTDVSLAALAGSVAALTSPGDVAVEIEPGLTAWADESRLEQILVNLVTNALRHGEPPILLTAGSEPGWVTVSVRDHGPGVPPPEVAHLFSRFSSADRSPQSVGLGLWIVKLLADAHGGHVSYVHAEPGAEFAVKLPVGSSNRAT